MIEGSGEGIPVVVPRWLFLSGISPHAIMLYGLYKLTTVRTTTPPSDIPRCPDELAAALHLDDAVQVQTAHQELLDVGAVEERQEHDENGSPKRILLIHELSPREKEEDDNRRKRWEELCAAAHLAPRAPKQYPGTVYVMQQVQSRPVKIGYSTNVANRHKNLQASNPNHLNLLWHTPGGRDLEDALHRRFHKYRVHGEWFDFGRLDPVKQIQRAVEQIQQNLPG